MLLQKCLMREVRLRPTTEELLAHPYLMNKDKDGSDSQTPPAQAGTTPMVCSTTPAPTTPGTKPVESRRLQELLKSHLVQGSPRTANAVNRVMVWAVCVCCRVCLGVCVCAFYKYFYYYVCLCT